MTKKTGAPKKSKRASIIEAADREVYEQLDANHAFNVPRKEFVALGVRMTNSMLAEMLLTYSMALNGASRDRLMAAMRELTACQDEIQLDIVQPPSKLRRSK